MPATYVDALVDAQARKLLRLSPAMRQRLIDRFYDGDDDRKKRVTDRLEQLESGDDPAHYRNPSELLNELETLDTSDDPGNVAPAAAAGAGAKKLTKAAEELRKSVMAGDTEGLVEAVAKYGTSEGARKGWQTRKGGRTTATAISRARAADPKMLSARKPKLKAESTRNRAESKFRSAQVEAGRSSRAQRALRGADGRTARAVRHDAANDAADLSAARKKLREAYSGHREAARQSNLAGYRAVMAAGKKRRARGKKITAGKAVAAQVRTVRRDMAASRNSDAVARLTAASRGRKRKAS